MASFDKAVIASGVTGYLDVSAVSLSGSYPNITANYSASIRWYCKFWGGVTYAGSTVSINGKNWTGKIDFSVTGKDSPSYGAQSFSVGLGTARSINIRVEASVNTYYEFNFSVGGTVTSPAVEPATGFAISGVSSITENSCVVSHTLSSTRNYWYVKLYDANTGNYWSLNTDNGNGTTTITGLNPNQTYAFRVRVFGRDGSYLGESGTSNVTTLGKSSIGNNPAYTIGGSFPLTINGYSDSFTHTAKFTVGSYIFTRTGLKRGSVTITPTAVENDALYQQVTTNQPKAMAIELTTYVNGTSIGSNIGSGTASVNQTICAPTVNSFQYADTNAITLALTGNNQYIIQDHSFVQVTGINAQAKNAATLQKYRVQINGSTFESTATTIHTTTVSSNTGITVYAIDSRTLQGSLSKSFVKYISYVKPSLESFVLHRENDIGSQTSLSFKGKFDLLAIDGKNKNDILSITYCFKKEKDTTYGADIPFTSVSKVDGTFSFNNVIGNFDTDSAYMFVIKIKDKINTYSFNGILNAGVMGLSMKKGNGKYAIGINKIPTIEKGLDVDGDIYANGNKLLSYPIGSIYMSINNINPAQFFGGTWERYAKGRTIFGLDENDTMFNSSGKTGGHKELQSHTHTITVASTGAHTHALSGTAASAGAHTHTFQGYCQPTNAYGPQVMSWNRFTTDASAVPPSMNSGGAHTHTLSGTAASAGDHIHTATAASSGAGNGGNLPPYITTFIWVRTA